MAFFAIQVNKQDLFLLQIRIFQESCEMFLDVSREILTINGLELSGKCMWTFFLVCSPSSSSSSASSALSRNCTHKVKGLLMKCNNVCQTNVIHYKLGQERCACWRMACNLIGVWPWGFAGFSELRFNSWNLKPWWVCWLVWTGRQNLQGQGF